MTITWDPVSPRAAEGTAYEAIAHGAVVGRVERFAAGGPAWATAQRTNLGSVPSIEAAKALVEAHIASAPAAAGTLHERNFQESQS